MKKTVALLAAIIVIAFTFIGSTEDAYAADKAGCCNQYFLVQDNAGSPVANCMVTVPGPCGSSGMTDAFGLVKLCLGTGCGTLTATAACCGAYIQFTPCSGPVTLTITCP